MNNQQQSIDFSALVQNNPTNVSIAFQSKLANKLKESFTEEQEKWYVANLYAYLKFHPTNDYVIDLENVFEMIGFAKKGNAKRTLEKHFIKGEDFKVALLRSEKRKNEGGFNKEVLMLNINTFKELCLLANTSKGKEIRKYYLKMEAILNDMVVAQSREYEVELAKKALIIECQEDVNQLLKEEKRLEKHNILLREFEKCSSMIYIIKVKSYEDSSYIIKIGESRDGVKSRFLEHRTNYEECTVLDCFKVRNSKKFENFLHEHLRLQKGKNYPYKQLLDTIDRNIKYYQDDYMENENLRLEYENLKMRSNMKPNYDLKNVMEMLTTMNNKIDKLEAKIDENKALIISRTAKMTTNFAEPRPTIGPRLQQINPETLHLVKVFETVTECLAANKNLSRSSISKAVKQHTVYEDFRWNCVDRDLDANVVENLPPTKITRVQNLGYIAKMNIDKTIILNIYLDRKTAAILNEYPSHASLDNPVKDCKQTRGNYYILYEDLADNIKEKYIIPVLYKNGIGKFDSQENLVKEFINKQDCKRNKELSEKSLAKALRTGMAYNGYFYRRIGEKLSC
jgi:phage anti-repressor protein